MDLPSREHIAHEDRGFFEKSTPILAEGGSTKAVISKVALCFASSMRAASGIPLVESLEKAILEDDYTC